MRNTGDSAKQATVYRAARCEIGDAAGRRSIHDAGTAMAGCDGAAPGGRLLAAWLPLTAGARRDAGSAEAVYGRVRAGQPLADTCACGSRPTRGRDRLARRRRRQGPHEPRLARRVRPGWLIPLTLAFKADNEEAQPLHFDDNAFTVTLRNPNAGERPVTSIAFDHGGLGRGAGQHRRS